MHFAKIYRPRVFTLFSLLYYVRYVVKSSKEQLKQIQRPSILFIGNFI